MRVVLALASLTPSSVLAETADATRVESVGSHVRLTFEGTYTADLATDIADDLRASLRERGITMELSSAQDVSALATVRLDFAEYATGRLRIVVEDALTRKVVERTIELAQEPVDVWSVLIAAAADELLRASWIELRLSDAPSPTRAVPAEIQEVVTSSLASPTSPLSVWGLGADASFVFSEGASFLGARLALTQASLSPLTLTLGVGAVALLPLSSERVRIEGVWLFADVETGIALLPRTGDVRLSIVVASRIGALVARATTSEAFLQTQDASAWAILLDGGFRGGFSLHEGTQLSLGLLVGAPLLGVTLSDGARDVASFHGLSLRAEVGVQVWL